MSRILPVASIGLLALVALAAVPTTRAADSAPTARIAAIEVKTRGVTVANPDFVLAHTRLREGDAADPRALARDVKTLQLTGRFSFVDATVETRNGQTVLVFQVVIRPHLAKPATVTGADAMGQRKIRNWLELEIGDTIDDAVLATRVRKVLDEYHQRFYPDAKIDWDIDTDAQTGFSTVRLTVVEGERASVRRVRFAGNSYAQPGLGGQLKQALTHRRPADEKSVPPEVLEEAVKPHLWHIWSFFTKRGVYNPDDLNSDRYVLRELYLNRGYLDAQVDKPTVVPYKPGKLEVIFPIEEGYQYRIGSLAVRGVTVFPETNLTGLIRLKPGDVAAQEAIDRTRDELRDYYQSRGYMRATVKDLRTPRPDAATVDIVFDVREGSPVSIRYLDIYGTTRTKDKVVRRELLLYPGEVYDLVRVRRSENVLRNLGFFGENGVSSYPRETLDPGRDDLVFEVEEGQTGNFMIGAGYSSVDALMGFVELSQGNFDIFNWPHFTGGGQKLRLRTQVGTQTEDYEISFVEPWFLDRKLSLGVDLYDTSAQNLSTMYSQQKIGGAVTLGKPLPGFWFQRLNTRYSLEDITLYDISTNAIPRVQAEKGSRLVSTIKPTLVHDSRDNVFVPHRGNRTTLSARLSGGPLGFDTDVYGFEGESMTYVPLWLDHILSLHGRAAVVDEYGQTDDVPIFDRLLLGGARDLRGFKYRYVGPYEDGQPIGGRTAAFAQIEYTVPITPKLIRAATFYDIGNVWLDAYDFSVLEYCSDVGLGVRIDIPNFPIRLDYAWPLEIDGDVSRTNARFNFWLGYGF